MAEPFNGLTPAEAERLALLIEECGEVIQAATKILRHGYHSANPDTAADQQQVTNRQALAMEVGHVFHVVERMLRAGDVSPVLIDQSEADKAERIGQWLHHQFR